MGLGEKRGTFLGNKSVTFHCPSYTWSITSFMKGLEKHHMKRVIFKSPNSENTFFSPSFWPFLCPVLGSLFFFSWQNQQELPGGWNIPCALLLRTFIAHCSEKNSWEQQGALQMCLIQPQIGDMFSSFQSFASSVQDSKQIPAPVEHKP